MLLGRYGNTSTAPYIEAVVLFPRLRLRGLVSFLVDTGADGSIVSPPDARKIGMDFTALRNPVTSRGIGGLAQGYCEPCVLTFSDKRYIYAYILDKMEVSAPSKTNYQFPSLLGRDILNKWRVVADYGRGVFACTPQEWDLRRRII